MGRMVKPKVCVAWLGEMLGVTVCFDDVHSTIAGDRGQVCLLDRASNRVVLEQATLFRIGARKKDLGLGQRSDSCSPQKETRVCLFPEKSEILAKGRVAQAGGAGLIRRLRPWARQRAPKAILQLIRESEAKSCRQPLFVRYAR
jgi:hypothetical protein